MAVKIVFFNHKGGVSKTTTTYNLGWILATHGKKVLLVDADPQCNLTQLVLGDDFEKYYNDSKTKHNNIKDGVKPAFEGLPKPITAVSCYIQPNNKNLYLLAGHGNLSEYDPALSFAQTSNNAIIALQNLPGAFNTLIEETCKEHAIDFVLIDLNPGLSAINQNLFITSDAFIVPTNPDPFSVMAVHTLSTVLPRWVEWADNSRNLFAESAYPLPNARPKFIGELIQRFNIRNGLAAKPYRDNMQEIKEAITTKFIPSIRAKKMLFSDEAYRKAKIHDDYCLSEIPDFHSLLQKAHMAGVPVFALTKAQINESGVVLAQIESSRDKFKAIFSRLAEQIITIQNYAKSD